jgi:hypothetical protein
MMIVKVEGPYLGLVGQSDIKTPTSLLAPFVAVQLATDTLGDIYFYLYHRRLLILRTSSIPP